MCGPQGVIADPTVPGVYFRDDYAWVSYSVEASEAIKAAVSSGLRYVDLGLIKSSAHPYGAHYTVDLVSMVQTNKPSGLQRPVKIIEHGSPTSQGALTTTQKQKLYRVIEEVRALNKVERILKERASNIPILAKRLNPYLQPGNHQLERFVDTMVQKEATIADSTTDGIIEFAFHGTYSYNVDPILQGGMRPTTQHWFGYSASTSVRYCRDSPKKMLLFLVLMLSPGLGSKSGDVIIMTNAAYELPIAEITVA